MQPSAEETTQASSEIDDLSISEILDGILVFMEDRRFSEQALYRFFEQLQRRYPSNASRFRVRRTAVGHLQSEPLRRALSFFEMGKVIEVAAPNPVDQFYRPRRSQLDSVKKELEARHVLPAKEEFLKQLAQDFVRSML